MKSRKTIFSDSGIIDNKEEDLPDKLDLSGLTYVLSDKVGVKLALQIAGIIRDAKTEFPKEENLLRELRNKRLLRDFIDGMTTDELKKKYDLCEKRVLQLTGKTDRDAKILC
jgi:Mor family transcriptional regulator